MTSSKSTLKIPPQTPLALSPILIPPAIVLSGLGETQILLELFDAISEGKTEVVRVIMTYLEQPAAMLKLKYLQGLTPLRKAVALNKPEIARILVSYGAEPSVVDPAGRTPLHIAVMQGGRDLMAPLLLSKDSAVYVQDAHGWTPLHFAVRGKHVKVVNWLLYAGEDVHLKNKEDKTPLDLCDEESPIRQMLEAYDHALDDGPIDLCSSFIGRKQLNQIGPDGLLLFVTSALWSERMQFILCIRIRPYRADPPIPLQLDEQYFSDVWHYSKSRNKWAVTSHLGSYWEVTKNSGSKWAVTEMNCPVDKIRDISGIRRGWCWLNFIVAAFVFILTPCNAELTGLPADVPGLGDDLDQLEELLKTLKDLKASILGSIAIFGCVILILHLMAIVILILVATCMKPQHHVNVVQNNAALHNNNDNPGGNIEAGLLNFLKLIATKQSFAWFNGFCVGFFIQTIWNYVL